jgi:hypothetical protein
MRKIGEQPYDQAVKFVGSEKQHSGSLDSFCHLELIWRVNSQNKSLSSSALRAGDMETLFNAASIVTRNFFDKKIYFRSPSNMRWRCPISEVKRPSRGHAAMALMTHHGNRRRIGNAKDRVVPGYVCKSAIVAHQFFTFVSCVTLGSRASELGSFYAAQIRI